MSKTSILLLIGLKCFLLALCCGGANGACSTWLYPSKEGWCTCGSSLHDVMICNNETEEVSILRSFCLTTFDRDRSEAVVGSCLYTQNHGQATGVKDGLYVRVNKNLSQQDHYLCSYLNRDGQLCGKCKSNYVVSAYSYDLKCYQCRLGLLSNIIIYCTVAYLPLTLFLVAVVMFHISVASPYLNLAVLLSQIYSSPEMIRVLLQNTRDTKLEFLVHIMEGVYGIWNLDFFRTLIPPICFPLTTIQVIALDYLVAVYPLLLLVCFYLLVAAHDRGYKLVVRLWKPFLWCSARMRRQWDIKHSIIDAFATFLLLSYLKFINISIDIFMPTTIFKEDGSQAGNFLYYYATIEFLGSEHMPFALISMTVLLVGVSFPLLLFLYPMMWFQNLLNKCHLNSPSLRAFMQCFQGYYLDRTDGGYECRYFSALYPTARIGGSILYAVTRNNVFFLLIIIVTAFMAVIVVAVTPYKKKYEFYNKCDAILLMSTIGFAASAIIYEFSFDWDRLTPTIVSVIMMMTFCFSPLAYLIILLFKKIKQSLLRQKESFMDSSGSEYHSLLDSVN